VDLGGELKGLRMKQFVITLSVVFSVFVITGCAQPIGTLEGPNRSKYAGDPMWLVPRRIMYQIDERFNRYDPSASDEIKRTDFQIFIVLNDGGGIQEVPVNNPGVQVVIEKDKGMSTYFTEDISKQDFYWFHRVGKHIVNVTYDGRSAWYAVEVWSPNNGNTIGGDGGIGIIWAD
jgi:hypothetical protein